MVCRTINCDRRTLVKSAGSALGAATVLGSAAARSYTATLTVTDDASATDANLVTLSVGGGGFEGYCEIADSC